MENPHVAHIDGENVSRNQTLMASKWTIRNQQGNQQSNYYGN